ncbi:MAG: hypothetical protein OET55_09465 [Desulfuromonadales bacterium]|nr:hypothetical protein [Desulfuromonadales bacterium]
MPWPWTAYSSSSCRAAPRPSKPVNPKLFPPEIIERYQQTLPMGLGINAGPVIASNVENTLLEDYRVDGLHENE